MANKLYDNFILENEIENQLKSHLNHQIFCTVDNSLVGTSGMVKKIHRYTATSGVEKLAMGEGNKKSITTDFSEVEYRIALAQTRFEHFDEEQMTDPVAIATGARMIASDLYNQLNDDIFAEFNKATKTQTPSALGFDAFADAIADLEFKTIEEDPKEVAPIAFALVNKKDLAAIRKNSKEELKYVEAFIRSGYVGTVAGVNLYVDKLAKEGEIIVATRDAVTLFNKKGVEVETARDANIRKTTDYARKYYVAALTDATKVVKLTVSKG